jgi:hypothetical protein
MLLPPGVDTDEMGRKKKLLGGPKPDWVEFFKSLDCSNRLLLDVSNLFHFLATRTKIPLTTMRHLQEDA